MSMSIALEFINLIIPTSLIKMKYPGGFEKCIEDHENLIGGRVWYDSHLFRDGAMNPRDMEAHVQWWVKKGFEPFEIKHGQKHFKDICIVETLLGGATLPCEWIDFSEDGNAAYLKGTECGELVGRWTFNNTQH